MPTEGWTDPREESFEIQNAVSENNSVFSKSRDEAPKGNNNNNSTSTTQSNGVKGWCRAALSIRTAVTSLLLIGVAVSVTSSELLSTTSCDVALDDTRAAGSDAMTSLHRSATKSLESIAQELLGHSSIGVKGMVRAFLSEGRQTALGMQQANLVHLGNVPKTDANWFDIYAPYSWTMCTTLPEDSPVLAMGLFAANRTMAHYAKPPGLPLFNGTRQVWRGILPLPLST